jgi:hypothetical protein
MSEIEIEPASLVRAIREQTALPITEDEAEVLARGLETAQSDEEFLASTLSAVRLIADRLTDLADEDAGASRMTRARPEKVRLDAEPAASPRQQRCARRRGRRPVPPSRMTRARPIQARQDAERAASPSARMPSNF